MGAGLVGPGGFSHQPSEKPPEATTGDHPEGELGGEPRANQSRGTRRAQRVFPGSTGHPSAAALPCMKLRGRDGGDSRRDDASTGLVHTPNTSPRSAPRATAPPGEPGKPQFQPQPSPSPFPIQPTVFTFGPRVRSKFKRLSSSNATTHRTNATWAKSPRPRSSDEHQMSRLLGRYYIHGFTARPRTGQLATAPLLQGRLNP